MEFYAQIRTQDVDPLEQRRERRELSTVRDALDLYFSKHVPERKALGKLSDSTVENYRIWTKPINSQIGNLKVVVVECQRRHGVVKGVPSATCSRPAVSGLAMSPHRRFSAPGPVARRPV